MPGNRITVYSLTEDELVRQTIAAYQTQYPDMYVEYQIGMDGGGVTRDSIPFLLSLIKVSSVSSSIKLFFSVSYRKIFSTVVK